MKQENIAKILLVRAVEEELPQRIRSEDLLEAHLAAGNPSERESWVARRAAYLVEHCLGPYATVLPPLETVLRAPLLVVLLSALVGLASNFIGPSAKIHVLWNPIVILIAWNIVIYGVLVSGLVIRGPRTGDHAIPDAVARSVDRERQPRPGYRMGFIERRFFAPVVSWLLGAKQAAENAREQATDIKAVAQRFAILYWHLVRPSLRLQLHRVLHLSAIGLAVGAVVGMYVRGLFFAYDVIWQSTFLNDPNVIAALLRYVLGPASVALRYPIPDTDTVAQLLTIEGAPAAPWINLYAMSALLFIILPRGFIALVAGHKIKGTQRSFQLDLSEKYYIDLLQRAQAISPKELEAKIRDAVCDEFRQVSARLAEVVCVKLYDERIVPQLWKFREEGGTLRGLEEKIGQECQSFGPALECEMLNLERDLDHRLVARVRRLLGDDQDFIAQPSGNLSNQVTAASLRTAVHVSERVGSDISKVVSTVVSGAVGVVVGTLSGGFGEALGVALLVGIVETGPVGWIIGAVVGIISTGVVFFTGRDKLRQGIKVVSLPATALKVALWTGRYERLIAEGRNKCQQAITESLVTQLDHLAVQIADHIWTGLRPLIGELQRPRVQHYDDIK